MKRFSFQAGVNLRIDGKHYLITEEFVDSASFTLIDLDVGVPRPWILAELLQRLENGSLEYVPKKLLSRGKKADRRLEPLSAMPEKRRARIELKIAVLEAVDRIPPGQLFTANNDSPDGMHGDGQQPAILEVIRNACLQARVKPISLSTYYNWRKIYRQNHDASELRDRYEERGRTPYLDPVVENLLALTLAAQVELVKARGRTGVLDRITPKTVKAKLRDVIPHGKQMPSTTLISQRIDRLPAFDLAVAKTGVRNAENQFRSASGLDRPTACLDRVEYDETRLRLVVVDETFGVPLGMPWLSWFVDSTSMAPIGFYVGFEAMSDISTLGALRHACLPKEYVKTEYPSFSGELVAGVPRGCVFDNGLTQHGSTIHAASIDVGFDYKYAPPYTPWFKSAVENMHNILNGTLLSVLPGFHVHPNQRPVDYDPKVNGCIGFRHFVYILHRWIAERYMMTPTGPFSLRPIDRWRAGTAKIRPEFLASTRDLDLTFGILRKGNLDHRGIRYENLWYRSEDMAALRRRFGASLGVDIKVNPADLGTIYWRDPDGKWRIAVAQFFEYAKGRGLYQHKLITRFSRERFGSDESEALVQADREFRELGQKALQVSRKLSRNSRIARAFGVGTENLLGKQSHDGLIGQGGGLFSDSVFNPFDFERMGAAAKSHAAIGNVQEAPLASKIARRRFDVKSGTERRSQ